jgi:hypothetical protein
MTNPHDVLHSASPTGSKPLSPATTVRLDPVQSADESLPPDATGDTLSNDPRMRPERAHPAEPPQRVAPSATAVFPMPTAQPPRGVPIYQPSYAEHNDCVPVYNPEGDANV